MRLKPLISIYARYEMRSRLLSARFAAGLPENTAEREICAPVHRDGKAYLVIRLQYLWGEFCRELVLRSAMGGCATGTGRILPRATGARRVTDIRSAIGLKELSGPGAKWEEPQFTINQAGRLGVVNYADISLGLSSASTELGNIKRLRNYLVHPNSYTSENYAQMTRRLGFRGLEPYRLLAQATPGSETVFDGWLSVLLQAAWNAVA